MMHVKRRGSRAEHATFESHMDGLALLRHQVRQSHTDLDECAAAWLYKPHSSTPRSPAVRLYTHGLCVEDITIQSVLRGTAPLLASLWPTEVEPADAATLRRYARVVYASTDSFLGGLSSNGLRRMIDLRKFEMGRRTVGWVMRQFVVQELAQICGEITDWPTPGGTATIVRSHPSALRNAAWRQLTGSLDASSLARRAVGPPC